MSEFRCQSLDQCRVITIIFGVCLLHVVGCIRPNPDTEAQQGRFSFSMKCFDKSFCGTFEAKMAGPLAGFTTLEQDTKTGVYKGPGTVSPAGISLPKSITIVVRPIDGKVESHNVKVPSIDGYDGYVDALYVVMLPTGQPAVKIVMSPDPFGVYVRRTGVDSVFDYTLLPDTEDAEYQEFRKLCKAAYMNDGDRVKHLLSQGASITWPDPRIGSALRQAAMHGSEELCNIISNAAVQTPVPTGDFFDVSVFLRLGKIASARRLLESIGSSRLTDSERLMLAKSSLYCEDATAIRFLIEEMEFDIDMSMNPVGAPKQGLVYAAVVARNESILRYLLTEANADPNRSYPVHSALDFAENMVGRGLEDIKPIVRLLKEYGTKSKKGASNRKHMLSRSR